MCRYWVVPSLFSVIDRFLTYITLLLFLCLTTTSYNFSGSFVVFFILKILGNSPQDLFAAPISFSLSVVPLFYMDTGFVYIPVSSLIFLLASFISSDSSIQWLISIDSMRFTRSCPPVPPSCSFLPFQEWINAIEWSNRTNRVIVIPSLSSTE